VPWEPINVEQVSDMIVKVQKYLSFLFVTMPLILCCGCGLAGLMGSPTSSEKKVKAEYNIARQTKGRILVLVDQLSWGKTRTDLRPYLTASVNLQLSKKAKVKAKYLIPYSKLTEFRSERADFGMLSLAQIGSALGAERILFVAIEDCQLYELAGTGYYNGSLDTKSFLFDVKTERVIWPSLAKAKTVSAGFDSQPGKNDAAAKMLAQITAHCIVRYFYDCQMDKFKIWGERADPDVKRWK